MTLTNMFFGKSNNLSNIDPHSFYISQAAAGDQLVHFENDIFSSVSYDLNLGAMSRHKWNLNGDLLAVSYSSTLTKIFKREGYNISSIIGSFASNNPGGREVQGLAENGDTNNLLVKITSTTSSNLSAARFSSTGILATFNESTLFTTNPFGAGGTRRYNCCDARGCYTVINCSNSGVSTDSTWLFRFDGSKLVPICNFGYRGMYVTHVSVSCTRTLTEDPDGDYYTYGNPIVAITYQEPNSYAQRIWKVTGSVPTLIKEIVDYTNIFSDSRFARVSKTGEFVALCGFNDATFNGSVTVVSTVTGLVVHQYDEDSYDGLSDADWSSDDKYLIISGFGAQTKTWKRTGSTFQQIANSAGTAGYFISFS